MSPVRVVLIDDTDDVRAVIGALLDTDGRFQVVGEAANGSDGAAVVRAERPDLVLLDLAMPVMDGLTALPDISEAAPGVKVIVLSAFGNDESVTAAMAGGAAAFVTKGGRLTDTLFPILDRVLDANGGQEAAGPPAPEAAGGRGPA